MAECIRGQEAGVIVITGGRVVTPCGVWEPGIVTLSQGRVAAVQAGAHPLTGCEQVIDARGLTVTPGLLDLHVHGAMGCDTMDATPEALEAMARFFARHGVTSFLPTTMTADRAHTLAAIRNVAACAGTRLGGAEVLGVHLEGPYLCAAQSGAQKTFDIRPASREEYEGFFAAGPVRLITLAPEIPANLALISYARDQGATVAVGHSQATYEQMMKAVSLGLSQATHTFNGMPALHHREPGLLGTILSCDALYAQMIVDLVHLHPAVVKLLVRAKGVERAILITDAMRAAGLADGLYDLGGQEVTVVGKEARLANGRLAGSTLTLDQAVQNVAEAAGIPWVEALRMATLTPAESLGVQARKGSLEPGKDADVVLWDGEGQVVMTVVRGKVVYQNIRGA